MSEQIQPKITDVAETLLITLYVRAPHRWGLGDPHGVESWGEGIRLLEAHYPIEEDEPHLEHIRFMRKVRFLARIIGIFHYQLGG